jgi:oligopeptide/dipeptide ABC transporter ATP-binding protein
MYAGKPVEFADRRTLYYRPHHPYTKGLIESIPSAEGERGRLKPIQGQPPSLIRLPSGCSFHPRCPYVMDQCVTEVPPLRQVAGSADHRSACWLPVDEVGIGGEVDRKREQVAAARRGSLAAESSDVLDDSDVVDGSAADVPAEQVAGTTGLSTRSQPLSSGTPREVRASTSPRARRVAQPAPPARPRSRAATAEPAAAAVPTTRSTKQPAAKKPAPRRAAAGTTAGTARTTGRKSVTGEVPEPAARATRTPAKKATPATSAATPAKKAAPGARRTAPKKNGSAT